jgi:hypothetical protein
MTTTLMANLHLILMLAPGKLIPVPGMGYKGYIQ